MNLIVKVAVLFGLCACTLVQAASAISPTKITALLPRRESGGSLYMYLDKASTEAGCANPVVVLRVDPALGINELAFKLMAQSIQLAFVMNKTVTVYFDGCLDGYYPKIYGIDVHQ
jgi:hypothetical protein